MCRPEEAQCQGRIQFGTKVLTYSLCLFLIVVVGVRATNLTRFIEYMCNIYIFK